MRKGKGRRCTSLLSVALVAMFLSAGCRHEPPPSDPASWAAIEAHNARLMRCNPLNLPGRAAALTSVEELHALLGQRFDDPLVRELTARLGKPVLTANPAYINLHEDGVTLVVGADERIEAVDLHGRTYEVRRFQGQLPLGLDFYDRSPEVEANLGTPAGCSREGRCLYIEQGVEVRYGPDACISKVTLRPEVVPGSALARFVQVRRDARAGVQGISILVAYATNLDAPARMVVRLKDDNGAVPEVIAARADLQRDGQLVLLADVPAGPHLGEVGAFVPFYALTLGAGTHLLMPSIELERGSTPPTAGPAVGMSKEQGAGITVNQPSCRWVELGVQSLTVKTQDYDHTSASTTYGPSKPELRWVIAQPGGTVFRSSERPSGFRATWNEVTPWLRVCEGDRLSLIVEDVDFAFHDDVEWITLTSSAILDGPASSTISQGKVEKLQLHVKQRATLPTP